MFHLTNLTLEPRAILSKMLQSSLITYKGLCWVWVWVSKILDLEDDMVETALEPKSWWYFEIY